MSSSTTPATCSASPATERPPGRHRKFIIMIRPLLIRGMLVGALAGLAAFAFAYAFGEPQVQHAIDFEDHLAALRHEPAAPELVSRGVQRTLGLLTGTVATGIA